MGAIERKIQIGVGWMALFKLAEQSLGLISTVILARILIPADFGLVAIATAVIAFLELLSAFSFDMALIQNQKAERRHYDTVWTFKVLLGMFTASALVLLAIPVSQIYHDPRLVSIMMVLAVRPLIEGLENIGVVAFRKELLFDQEFRFLIGKKLVGFVVTVSLAFLLRSYWALVVGVVIAQTFGVGWSYWMHPYRPKFCLTARFEIISFSKWLLLNNFISFFYLRSADLIIGRVAGPGALGLYSIAYDVSNLPTTQMIAPINRAIFPGYAKMSTDKAALREGFLKIIAAIALLALPAAAGIAATAEFSVNVIFGEKWSDAAPLIQILAFYGAITALETNTYYIHLALGNVRTFTTLIGLSVVVLIPLLISLTIWAGATGAATAYLLVAILFFPLFYRAVMRKLDLNTWQLVKCLWVPITATAIMYTIVRLALQFTTVDTPLDDLAELCGLVLLGVSSYCVTVLCLWYLAGRPDGPERFVLDNVKFIICNKILYGKRRKYGSATTEMVPDTEE